MLKKHFEIYLTDLEVKSFYAKYICAINFFTGTVWKIEIATGKPQILYEDGGFMAIGDIDLYEGEDSSDIHIGDFYGYHVAHKASGEIKRTTHMWVTPIQNINNVYVNEKHAIVSGWFENTVQRLDRVSGESIDLYHGFDYPFDTVELEDESIWC